MTEREIIQQSVFITREAVDFYRTKFDEDLAKIREDAKNGTYDANFIYRLSYLAGTINAYARHLQFVETESL